MTLDKIERLARIIALWATLPGAVIGGLFTGVTHFSEHSKRKQEIIINLKGDLAKGDTLRSHAVQALANYPKEGLPAVIACLGSTKSVEKEGRLEVEEDTAFTSTVKETLRRMGKDAVYPLIEDLSRRQVEIRGALAIDEDGRLSRLYSSLPLAVFESLDKKDGAVRDSLSTIARWNGIGDIKDEEIDVVIKKLEGVRASRLGAVIANRNGTDTLAYLLRTQGIKHLKLPDIDLSHTYLLDAKLAGADLRWANLIYAQLNWATIVGSQLLWADLSGADLTGANLSKANLEHANLSDAVLAKAILSGANLRDAELGKVKGFKEVKDFNKVDLRGSKGLSKEDLEYARSRGAIID
ncbi:MAG: pentapeptide repeat-containing protein [Candidatus Brocadiales bacterium]